MSIVTNETSFYLSCQSDSAQSEPKAGIVTLVKVFSGLLLLQVQDLNNFSGNDFEFRPEVDRKWTKKKTEPFCILPYNKIDILKSDEIFSNRNFFEIFNSATSFPTMYNSVSITTFEGYRSLMRFGVKCGWDWWFGHVTTWTDMWLNWAISFPPINQTSRSNKS